MFIKRTDKIQSRKKIWFPFCNTDQKYHNFRKKNPDFSLLKRCDWFGFYIAA